MFKKLVPVVGLLVLAGPVFAADAPPASSSDTPAASSTHSAKSHHHKAMTHKHAHHKKAAKPS